MELLPEIWRLLVPYFTLEHLNTFRICSREHCDYTKSYEGGPREFATPYSLKRCFRCYPNLKRLNTEYCFVDCKDFLSFETLEELFIDIHYLVRDTLFVPCVQLKKLYLSSNHFYSDRNLDAMFKYLPQLTHLSLCNVEKVTDTAFHFSNQIETLEFSGHCSITSLGIRQLKHLKKLSIYEGSSLIRDEAFEGMPIEELSLHKQDFITDQGICHLKQLRKVVCINVPHVQGEGWAILKKLETVGFGCMQIHTISNFKMAKTLSFQECRILGKWSGLWRNLEKLRLHRTTTEYPDSIKTILCPRLRNLRIIRCIEISDYEDVLCKAFGTKVSFSFRG